MKTKNIIVLNTEEINAISKDSITLSASELSHIKAIDEIATMLSKEVEAYKNAIKEKFNHADYEDTSVKLKTSDYFQFNGDAFKKEYPELHQAFKTKAIHKETVTIK